MDMKHKKIKRRIARLNKKEKKGLTHKVISYSGKYAELQISKNEFKNMRCYANSLGGCVSGISKEHYISKNILELFGKISSTGIPWIDNGKNIPASAVFVSNCLCEYHNSFLSNLDNHAGELFRNLESFYKIRNKTHIFNGQLFERWMLKVLIGLISTGKVNGVTISDVPEEWIEILFGTRKMPIHLGLFSHFQVGDKINIERKFEVETLTINNSIKGVKISLCDITFWLSMVPIEDGFKEFAQKKILYRVKRLQHRGNNFNLDFIWE